MRRERDERGGIAIIVALCATLLLVVAAFVVDFGMVRIDRQIDKSAADAATIAGLHALNGGDANPRPFVGVCTAIRYLQSNGKRFAAMSDSDPGGRWTNGNDVAVGNGCTDAGLRAQACTPGSPASWAKFTWNGTLDGEPLNVVIQSGYLLASNSGFAEDALPAAAAENDDSAQGCDQLAVIINQQRQPGFGSLATDAALKTSVRSVGRVRQAPGGNAPALLLLQRTGCPVLQVGSVGGGADSRIRVFGALSTNNLAQPGSIHADSDGVGCTGGGNSVFYGKGADRIVAFAAPTVGNPTVPDAAQPGLITSFAGITQSLSAVRDVDSHVYGSAELDPGLAAAGTHIEPAGRPLLSRKPVDERYRPTVKSIVDSAEAGVFSVITSLAAAAANNFQVVACNPSGKIVTLPTYDATKAGLYISCGNLKESATLGDWRTVVFSGRVTPSGAIAMPDATKVYVFGGSSAIDIGTGSTFQVGAPDLSTSRCTEDETTRRSVLVVRNGSLNQSGSETSILRLCNTTAVLMGGSANGCVPTYGLGSAPSAVPGPTLSPCSSASGSGQIKSTGGVVDWTAPNQYDVMTLANGDPDPARRGAWEDPTGPEDLALWSESGANDSGPIDKASMGGGGSTFVRGVFMTPNFRNLTVGGGSLLDLRNAQFIATSIALNGGTQLLMRVDPNSAITLPKLTVVGLVR